MRRAVQSLLGITITQGTNMNAAFNLKQFLIVVLLVSIWVNASEVFRYFVIVMPETRQFLSMVPNIAPMDWGVFFVW